jgi:transcriptional regulator with XRE-family HTH domain
MDRDECQCGGKLRVETVPTFRVESLGIDGVDVIDAVQKAICETCGKIAHITIPDLPELIAAAALWRCMIPIKLNAEEIRFLRQALDLQQKQLAEELGVEPETVCRWENRQNIILEAIEKNFRQYVGAQLSKQAPGIRFDASVVARMKLQGPRPCEVIPMSFCRVLLAPEQESWNPRRKMAVNS